MMGSSPLGIASHLIFDLTIQYRNINLVLIKINPIIQKGECIMEEREIQKQIYDFSSKMKGKKKLKEKDIIKEVSASSGEDKEKVKAAMRAMINEGVLMYSYGGGASSVEIPSDEYLKEKGLDLNALLKEKGLI